MSNTLSVILGHGSVAAAVDRMLPLVKRLGHPIVVCCPQDDPLPDAIGLWKESERGGKGGFERMWTLIEFLHGGADDAIIFEYDAVCLKPHPVVEPGLRGIGGKFPDPAFYTQDYVMSPWTLDREAIENIWHAKWNNKSVREFGEADRLLSAWAFLGGVPMIAHHEPSFSLNTIGMRDVLDVPKDAKWIHGIKSAEVFNALIPHGTD